jgi:hypothetical protein
VAVALPASAATAVKVIDTTDNEWTEAVENGFTAWAVDTADARYEHRVRVKPASGAAYFVNAASTVGDVGNIELDGDHGDLLVYNVERSSSGGDRNVAFWDLGARSNLFVPKGINTSTKSERWASVSGDHLVFTRGPKGSTFGSLIILYTFSTKKFTTIANAPDNGVVQSGRVNGDFVVYTSCPENFRCLVFRYQISTKETKQLPNGGKSAYYPTVTPDGTVYYVQGSVNYCGVGTQIRRWHAGQSSQVTSFEDGIEVGPTYVREVGAQDRVYFTRVQCTDPRKYGIWKVDA